ncbi:hypothetical protein HYH03_010777 [Edaphochlamys debaryana]|uniref:BTB domain-containing protein n=1 Tax=Edaphochlamys debaryana TaxID=47281 RepID=A0A835XW20_9CHLO|nr:hypothetical protein HYH03_010777 [Edaphochlamys debaryana]|eukprot:KAG2490859.1 hypothetical protein HYH03_010777 [Edaphochlamys debaryana]
MHPEETLLLTSHGHWLKVLGTTTRGPLSLFTLQETRKDRLKDIRLTYGDEDEPEVSDAKCPVWEPKTGAIYIIEGGCVARVSDDLKLLTPVAGERAGGGADAADEEGSSEDLGSGAGLDGDGSEEGFLDPTAMVADSDGRLYVADGDCIRCVTLPRIAAGRKRLVTGEAAAAAGEAQVSTLPFRAAAAITGLAYVPASAATGGGGLAFSTATAVYWLPWARGSSAASATGTGPDQRPLCLAGTEGLELEEVDEAAQAEAPKPGPAAFFSRITALSTDGRGDLLLLMVCPSGNYWVRRVNVPSGVTTTLAVDVAAASTDFSDKKSSNPSKEIKYALATVLPNGYLMALQSARFFVVDLGLRPLDCLPPSTWEGASRAAEASTQLCADLGALLDRQPDGTADLSLVVGWRTFHAHRSILAARSRYLQCLLAGGFSEGQAGVLDLPDADPDALALALKWVYTGAVDVTPGKVQAVVELADRLELLQLGETLQSRILAEVTAETVVDTLLWADARQLHPLRHALKAWYLAHQRQVLACAAGSVRRLMAASPDLSLELQAATAERAAACSVVVR